MKRILILGAGFSSASLIKYLLEKSKSHKWKVVIGDLSKEKAEEKIAGHPGGESMEIDVNQEKQRIAAIQDADIVISMLPSRMHDMVAEDCVEQGKHMVTASYTSPGVAKLDQKAKKKGVIILNEMGVDPGIDHMSAMQIIHRIQKTGGKLKSFESATGGLVAPEFDTNPWNYKFTWNPRNVVVAGQGVSKFLHNGHTKYIPYHRLFARTELVNVLDIGEFEIYPNRDSFKYIDLYGLNYVETVFRGTIRRPGYSKAWDVFVQLGMTDDSYIVDDSENMTYRDFINGYLPYERNVPVEKKLCKYVGIKEDSDIMHKLTWSGIFERERVGLKDATPAQILQALIEPKWQLDPDDKDMIVMLHQFEYQYDDIFKKLTATLVVKGKDQNHTAMAITVGVPVAIATKLILENKITLTGVQLPLTPEIYEPVLQELTEYGVKFVEEESLI